MGNCIDKVLKKKKKKKKKKSPQFQPYPDFYQVLSYLPTPPLGQDMTQGQFLSGVLTGLNSEFSFS